MKMVSLGGDEMEDLIFNFPRDLPLSDKIGKTSPPLTTDPTMSPTVDSTVAIIFSVSKI